MIYDPSPSHEPQASSERATRILTRTSADSITLQHLERLWKDFDHGSSSATTTLTLALTTTITAFFLTGPHQSHQRIQA